MGKFSLTESSNWNCSLWFSSVIFRLEFCCFVCLFDKNYSKERWRSLSVQVGLSDVARPPGLPLYFLGCNSIICHEGWCWPLTALRGKPRSLAHLPNPTGRRSSAMVNAVKKEFMFRPDRIYSNYSRIIFT